MFSKNSETSGRTILAFAIYDAKAESYGPPFFEQSKGSAIRAFTEAANDRTSTIGKYPADFSLFHIGTYNPDDARMESLKTSVHLGLALEFQTQQQPQLPSQLELSRIEALQQQPQ